MATTEPTISLLAGAAYAWFEQAKRGDGDEVETFWRTRDGVPEWIADMVREAHGGRMPDDWHYAAIVEVLSRIAEVEAEGGNDLGDYRGEIVDGLVDVYTGDLTAWLASDVRNVYYISETLSEFGSPGDDGFRLLAMAQYQAYDEIYGNVVSALVEELEGRE